MEKKIIHKYIFLFLMLLTPGCWVQLDTPTPPISIVTPVVISRVTGTQELDTDERPTPSRTTRATETPTPSITLSTIVVEDVFIPMEEICPMQRVVPFEMLEIDSELGLLVIPSESVTHSSKKSTPMIISPGSSVSKLIEELDSTSLNYREAVSPDNKRIILYRKSETENQKVVWVSSIDGKDQFQVAQTDKKNLVSWVNEQEIIILGRPNADEFHELEFWDYFPFLRINLLTNKETNLTHLSHEEEGKREYIGYLTYQNNAYALYSEFSSNGLSYYLHNYNTGENLPVFQWLNDADLLETRIKYHFKPVWVYDDNKFAIFVGKPYGIDVALNIDFDTAVQEKNYDEIMKEVSIPDRFLPISILGVVPEKKLAIFQSLDPHHVSPNWLYLFDFKNGIIIDYCYEFKDAAYPPKISPDGRFASINFQRNKWENDQSLHYGVIFDLTTGQFAYLNEYYVIDWVIISETY